MAEEDDHPVLIALNERLPDAILSPNDFRLTHSILGEGITGSIMCAEYGDMECAAKPVRVNRIPREEREVDTLIAEFSKLYSLKHANIVEFLGLCIPPVRRASDRTIWMLTKRAEGNLRECLNKGACAQWSTKQRLLFLRDLISGIEYIHREGVAHLDLKPENILVGDQHRPLITDFGLSRFAPSGETVMSVLAGAGTPFYMPREQAMSGKRVTVAADLFAFALIALEVLTGVHPLIAKFGRDVAQAHAFVMSGRRISFDLSSISIELEDKTLFNTVEEVKQLESLLKKCLSAQAEDRPAAFTMYQHLDLLTEFTRTEVIEQFAMKLTYFREKCSRLTLANTELSERVKRPVTVDHATSTIGDVVVAAESKKPKLSPLSKITAVRMDEKIVLTHCYIGSLILRNLEKAAFSSLFVRSTSLPIRLPVPGEGLSHVSLLVTPADLSRIQVHNVEPLMLVLFPRRALDTFPSRKAELLKYLDPSGPIVGDEWKSSVVFVFNPVHVKKMRDYVQYLSKDRGIPCTILTDEEQVMEYLRRETRPEVTRIIGTSVVTCDRS